MLVAQNQLNGAFASFQTRVFFNGISFDDKDKNEDIDKLAQEILRQTKEIIKTWKCNDLFSPEAIEFAARIKFDNALLLKVKNADINQFKASDLLELFKETINV